MVASDRAALVPSTAHYVLGGAAYTGLLAGAFFTFWLWSTTLLLCLARWFPHVTQHSEGHAYQVLLYYFGNLAIGLAVLVFVVVSLSQVREAIERHRLAPRLARLALSLVAANLLGLALQVLARGA